MFVVIQGSDITEYQIILGFVVLNQTYFGSNVALMCL